MLEVPYLGILLAQPLATSLIYLGRDASPHEGLTGSSADAF